MMGCSLERSRTHLTGEVVGQMGALDGKVAVVTGAGRGIGRAEALLMASLGAEVIVNDLDVPFGGGQSDDRPAALVVGEIRAAGGTASANFSDVATQAGAEELITQALEEFGRLDILVNNAGILRDGMLFSIDPDEWKAVIDVHLLGHFLPTRAAARYWRDESKKSDAEPPHRAVIHTSSESGLFGNAGQSNYDVAKMGIVSLAVAASRELAKYGVTSNAIAPRARTRMTTATFENSGRAHEFAERTGFDPMDPANIAPFVAYLGSDLARHITGQVFILYGGVVGRVRLPHLESTIEKAGTWTVEELAEQAGGLFAELPPNHLESPRGYARLPKQPALAQ
jgi:NAD(P)-dependent dehydrogenase (short-subunit alcohol dehydrogenase family)